MSRSVPLLRQTGAAGLAARVVFAVSGLLVASWAARIPQASAQLHLSPGQLGALLFTQAAGGLIAAPLAGTLVAHIGARRSNVVAGVGLGLGLAAVGAGSTWSVGLTVGGLIVLGAAIGLGDVAMTVHVAELEQASGAALLSAAYGWFGLGGLAGAAIGAACAALQVASTLHLILVGLVGGAIIVIASRAYGSRQPSTLAPQLRGRGAGRRAAQGRRTTVVLCAISATFAFAESAGNDWIGVSLTHDRGQSAATAAIAFGSFVAAVTLGRFGLPMLLVCFPRPTVLRLSALAALAGVGLFAVAPSPITAITAAVVWGAGGALGIPTALQLAGEDLERAATRIAAVTSSMYIAFLAAPPVIGLLGDAVPVAVALLIAVPLLATAAVLSDARLSVGSPTSPDGPDITTPALSPSDRRPSEHATPAARSLPRRMR